MKRTKLDNLLRKWAADNSVTDKSLAVVTDRISSRIRAESVPAPPCPDKRFMYHKRYVFGGLAAAAMILLIGLIPGLILFFNSDARGIDAMVTIQPADTYATSRVFAETQRVFDSGLQWLAESDGQVEIGLSDDSHHKSAYRQPLLLKVLLLQRRGVRGHGRILWKGKIVTGSEQLITVTPDTENPGNTLKLWMYSLNGAGIMVDFSLDFDTPAGIHASSANHVISRKPVRVLSTRRGDATYEMYIAATKLPRNQMGTDNSL